MNEFEIFKLVRLNLWLQKFTLFYLVLLLNKFQKIIHLIELRIKPGKARRRNILIRVSSNLEPVNIGPNSLSVI